LRSVLRYQQQQKSTDIAGEFILCQVFQMAFLHRPLLADCLIDRNWRCKLEQLTSDTEISGSYYLIEISYTVIATPQRVNLL
jgi:hypothetical protein